MCPHQKPEVPPEARHPLHTHDSATMGSNFADRNGSTLNFGVSNRSRRKRAQTQIVGDNKKLLQCILSARTAYSRAQYSEEQHKWLQLRHNVSKHPQYHTAGGVPGSASTSQLPAHTRTARDKLQRHHSSSELRSSAALDASLVDEEVHSPSPAKIRLAATTHLKKHSVKQRPLSASVSSTISSTSSPYDCAAWHAAASPESRRRHQRGSESVVDRLRAMAIDQQNGCESGGDGEARVGEGGGRRLCPSRSIRSFSFEPTMMHKMATKM
ncbi:hypothetical protein FI667_g16597, partial [Globisporangium splendens]